MSLCAEAAAPVAEVKRGGPLVVRRETTSMAQSRRSLSTASRLTINATDVITDSPVPSNFVCATLDWWPERQVDFDRKPWVHNVTIPTLDVEKLKPFVRGLSGPGGGGGGRGEGLAGEPRREASFILRIGGSCGDLVVYQEEGETAPQSQNFFLIEQKWEEFAAAHRDILPKSSFEPHKQPEKCHAFEPDPNNSPLYYTNGCLTKQKWKEILDLCDSTSEEMNASAAEVQQGPAKASSAQQRRPICRILFGLNGLFGYRHVVDPSTHSDRYFGRWNPRNAFFFLYELVHVWKKAHLLAGFELGNELAGISDKPGKTFSVEHYAADYRILRAVLDWFKESHSGTPWRIFGVASWLDVDYLRRFEEVLKFSDFTFTHHLYSLGSGGAQTKEDLLRRKVLNATYLDESVKPVALAARELVRQFGGRERDEVRVDSVDVWVGEAGGAWGSGAPGVTDAFFSGFWFLDQLALFASTGNHGKYCRQTLVGGYYELVRTKGGGEGSSVWLPNVDYYVSSLWNTLIVGGGNFVFVSVGGGGGGGRGGLAATTTSAGASSLRAYAHVRNVKSGTVMVLILLNLSEEAMEVEINAEQLAVLNSGASSSTSRVGRLWVFEEDKDKDPAVSAVAAGVGAKINGDALTWTPEYASAQVWIEKYARRCCLGGAGGSAGLDDALASSFTISMPGRSYGFVELKVEASAIMSLPHQIEVEKAKIAKAAHLEPDEIFA
eukprot:g9080.t1